LQNKIKALDKATFLFTQENNKTAKLLNQDLDKTANINVERNIQKMTEKRYSILFGDLEM